MLDKEILGWRVPKGAGGGISLETKIICIHYYLDVLPLKVRIPLCNEGSVNDLSRWMNTLVDINDDKLTSFTHTELKLIILSAHDWEQVAFNQNQKNNDQVDLVLRSLVKNADGINIKVQENTKLIVNNTNTFKSYAEEALTATKANTDMYNVIREEENKHANLLSDRQNKRNRVNNVTVYGLPDMLTVEKSPKNSWKHLVF